MNGAKRLTIVFSRISAIFLSFWSNTHSEIRLPDRVSITLSKPPKILPAGVSCPQCPIQVSGRPAIWLMVGTGRSPENSCGTAALCRRADSHRHSVKCFCRAGHARNNGRPSRGRQPASDGCRWGSAKLVGGRERGDEQGRRKTTAEPALCCLLALRFNLFCPATSKSGSMSCLSDGSSRLAVN